MRVVSNKSTTQQQCDSATAAELASSCRRKSRSRTLIGPTATQAGHEPANELAVLIVTALASSTDPADLLRRDSKIFEPLRLMSPAGIDMVGMTKGSQVIIGSWPSESYVMVKLNPLPAAAGNTQAVVAPIVSAADRPGFDFRYRLYSGVCKAINREIPARLPPPCLPPSSRNRRLGSAKGERGQLIGRCARRQSRLIH